MTERALKILLLFFMLLFFFSATHYDSQPQNARIKQLPATFIFYTKSLNGFLTAKKMKIMHWCLEFSKIIYMSTHISLVLKILLELPTDVIPDLKVIRCQNIQISQTFDIMRSIIII